MATESGLLTLEILERQKSVLWMKDLFRKDFVFSIYRLGKKREKKRKEKEVMGERKEWERLNQRPFYSKVFIGHNELCANRQEELDRRKWRTQLTKRERESQRERERERERENRRANTLPFFMIILNSFQ